MIACPGAWKNFEEIEEALSIAELMHILEARRERDRQRWREQVMLATGEDIDKDKDESEVTFETIKRRAVAKARGISEEQLEFEEIGIVIEEY